jgi:nucleotide-binding universal stress UspA family protein
LRLNFKEVAMQATMERALTEATIRASTYATILIHVEPGVNSSHRVEVAAQLSQSLNAHLIGLGAETFDPGPYTSGAFMTYSGAEFAGLVQKQISRNLEAAEAAFRRDAAGADIEWRMIQTYPHQALASMARAVDLIVVSPKSERGDLVSADPAEVLMTAGRPLLIVPATRSQLMGDTVLVAWKNTRECRRALTDAMPFLQRADKVVVNAIVDPDASAVAAVELDDVVANLRRHDVHAVPLMTTTKTDAVERELERIAEQIGADLIVAGGYGHSRLREWAFGGVTESFLRRPGCFVLLSH